MHIFIIRIICTLSALLLISCATPQGSSNTGHAMESMSKPYARYWWFASEMQEKDIAYNLDWLKSHGFGGVELAWVYPLNRMNPDMDSTFTPRQAWLSPQWQKVVAYAISYADSIGLACDLTMGTLWPFGDSYVSYEEASQTYGRHERQQIRASWEYPVTGYVVDHLNPLHYQRYFQRMLDSFPQPAVRLPQAYFIDSWEVETRQLWTDGFGEEFESRFGYDIRDDMDSLYRPGYGGKLYDYMSLISEKVVQFYDDYTRALQARGLFSRAQCAGSPADILSAYARVDIPEGEAMLYEPEYNLIPASAATLAGKKVVSAEAFTCIYGWPRDYLREEQTADLKLVADALFAHGVNHIVWHGKPHNPAQHDTVSFYASVHVGPGSMLADEIPAFNNYLSTISAYMKKGHSYTDIAVYLPTEDAWTRGILPQEQQMRWLWGFYEMRNQYFPDELAGYHPTWINREFLKKGVWKNNTLEIGDAHFDLLYVDARYLDLETLKTITLLASEGLPVTLKQLPLQAGSAVSPEWQLWMDELVKLPHVSPHFEPVKKPLVKGNDLPPYRARTDGKTLWIFFAHPEAARLRFPLDYGQSLSATERNFDITIDFNGQSIPVKLQYQAFQSLLYQINGAQAQAIDISFVPKTPVYKPRPSDYIPPWK